VSSASLTLRHLDGSTSLLAISTHNNSRENVFVQRLLVNGVEHSSPFIDRSVLAAKGGVTLEFFMQAEAASGLCPVAV
jgi:putative alpha-1,2-mannosidase